jgi:glycogen(starch) synthase
MATDEPIDPSATGASRRSVASHRGRPIIFHQSAGAVVMIDRRCLVLRRADRDEWIFPKGHLEQGESSEDAAIREAREETGLEIEIVEELGSTRYAFGRHREQHKRVDWFLARSVGGALGIEPLFAESALLDADEAQSVLTHAADREVAARAFALAQGLE